MPDLDRILELSKIFGVTTDLLLKEELEIDEQTVIAYEENTNVKKVSMEQAKDYLEKKRKFAFFKALGMGLAVFSLCTFTFPGIFINVENEETEIIVLIVIGLVFLGILVTAISIVGKSSQKLRDYLFIDTQEFNTEYGVTEMVKKEKAQFEQRNRVWMFVQSILLIIGLVPFIVQFIIPEATMICLTAMFFVQSFTTFFAIKTSTIKSSFEELLQEGNYTVENKETRKVSGGVALIVFGLWVIGCLIAGFVFHYEHALLLFFIGLVVMFIVSVIVTMILDAKKRKKK